MDSVLKCETRSISRRHFAQLAAVGAAMAAARPAIAQATSETVRWRLTSSFPKNLDTLFGGANTICRIVGELTDGKFSIQPFAAGEIVPGLQVLDAVSNATVECGQTYTGYYIGKEPAMIFDGSLPFGLTPRQHSAWLLFGDGRKVAKYYYTPGVMELEAFNQLFINKATWAALPPAYQAALRYACWYALNEMLASYDAKNAKAINRVVAGGAQLSVLSPEIIKALRGALESVLDEEAGKNPLFKKILDNWRQWRAEQHRWFGIADTRAELAVYST